MLILNRLRSYVNNPEIEGQLYLGKVVPGGKFCSKASETGDSLLAKLTYLHSLGC